MNRVTSESATEIGETLKQCNIDREATKVVQHITEQHEEVQHQIMSIKFSNAKRYNTKNSNVKQQEIDIVQC